MTNQITTKDFFNSPNVQNKFNEILGKNSKAFVNSLISITSDNRLLSKANPHSIMKAAMKAATLNLAIEPSLGFAYIVPYKQEAQFQLGYKGLIQLAVRSGQIKNINSGIVYENQFISFDPLFEDLEVDFSIKPNDKVAGYFASLRLINGLEKVVYWEYEKVYAHGKRFSKSFNNGPWKSDFDAMAQKTVLKSLLGTYAPLSLEMTEALVEDNKGEDVKAEPVDVTPEEKPENLSDILNVEPVEVKQANTVTNLETGEIEEVEQLELGDVNVRTNAN